MTRDTDRSCYVCGQSVNTLEMWQEELPEGLKRGHRACLQRLMIADRAMDRERRLGRHVRVLRAALAEIAQECGICDYGLPGECTCCPDPVQAARKALNRLVPATDEGAK